jgi:capsular exopolysaccharide synthesis family protein
MREVSRPSPPNIDHRGTFAFPRGEFLMVHRLARGAGEIPANRAATKLNTGDQSSLPLSDEPHIGQSSEFDLPNTIRRIYTLSGWTGASQDTGRVLAIGSAVSGEGKSTLAHAIAISAAHDLAGNILLVECDLISPTLEADFGVETGPGLAQVLGNEGDIISNLATVIRPTTCPNLWLLPAGTQQDNPSRLLRSQRMETLLSAVQARFSYVILDLPAVLENNDSAVLARLTDGVVIVVRSATTDRRAVQQAIWLLSGARIHGVVLNRFSPNTPKFLQRLLDV